MANEVATDVGTEVDIVVVGSGAGGAPVAWTLAKAGASVLLLDRGPRYTRADFVHDEVRVARRDFFVPSADQDPHVVVVKGRPPERTNEGWVGRCVGGATIHMSGFFYRFAPDDFRVRTLLGGIKGATHADWPVSYEEMAPFFDMVDTEVGVSGPPDEGAHAAPRSRPYPMPAVDVHPASALIDAAAKKLGVHAFATPRAVLSRDYRERQRCTYCHLCGGFGCEVTAKGSTMTALIPAAEATGNCSVIGDAMIHQIVVDDSGRARGVIYRSAGGIDREIKTRVVVVACSAIESVRLLLMSQSGKFPHGVANNGGQVGRNVMFSTLSKAHGSFRFDKDPARAEMLKDHAPFLGRSVLDYYLARDRNAKVQKGGALNFLFASGGPIFQSEMLAVGSGGLVWGKELKASLADYWLEQKQFDCETFGEYLPNAGTRVELDPEVEDSRGWPVARILIDRHPHDFAVSDYLADKAAALLDEAGADKVWRSNPGGRTMHLPMGGCRMGDDPDSSVVDKNCQTHEVKGLFVSDGSVFPSSGGVPPTYTLLANAFRVGAGIRDALARKDL